jgi:hypothetical protein
MENSFNQEQVTILVKSLIETINTKNEEIELNESYGNMLGDVIDQLNDEIASLKTKLKAKASKALKAPKVIKAPKAIKKVGRPAVKKIAPKDMDAETAKIVKATGGNAYTASAPAKRKPGRPKKVVA